MIDFIDNKTIKFVTDVNSQSSHQKNTKAGQGPTERKVR